MAEPLPKARRCSGLFTVPDIFKAALKQNTSDGPLCFLVLEKEDPPAQNSNRPFIRLNAENNVYMASGAELHTTLGSGWSRPTPGSSA